MSEVGQKTIAALEDFTEALEQAPAFHIPKSEYDKLPKVESGGRFPAEGMQVKEIGGEKYVINPAWMAAMEKRFRISHMSMPVRKVEWSENE